MIFPLVILLYMCASFDKSNLGNAKTLGMIKDITVDKDGSKYAFLNSLYYIGYSPFSQSPPLQTSQLTEK